MADEEGVERVNGAREDVDGGDEQRAGDDEGLAGKVVAEPAGEGGGDHVSEEEVEGE